MRRVLVIDDDSVFAEVLAKAFRRRGYEPTLADSTESARAAIAAERFPYAVLDLRIAQDNGLELIPALVASSPEMRIVMLTGYASIATAVDAIKLGAHHYLTKPTGIDAIIAAFDHQPGTDSAPAPGPTSLERLEWEYIQKALIESDGKISVAAARLGLHRRTLQRKLKKRPAGLN